MVGPEEIRYTYRFAATPRTARGATVAYFRAVYSRPRPWVALLVIYLVTTLICLMATSPGNPASSRLASALFLGGLLTVFAWVLVTTMLGMHLSRRFRSAMSPGTWLQAGFGHREFITSNGRTSARISYAEVRSVVPANDFVFIRFVGAPHFDIQPREVFPPEAISFIRRVNDRG